MEKKKSVPQQSLSFEESSSEEEEENEQGFVRSDRTTESAEGKRVQQSDEDSGSDEDDGEDEEIGGIQRRKADTVGTFSSEGAEQGSGSEGDSDTGSGTSSASAGKPSKPAHQFVVLHRRAANANGHSGKKVPTSEKSLKEGLKRKASPKKGKDKVLKRNRDSAVSEPAKGSSKKQRKDRSDFVTKSAELFPKEKDFDKSSKEKVTHTGNAEKKKDSKKSAHAAKKAEKAERMPTDEMSSKKPESVSKKKANEKGGNDMKSFDNADAEVAEGPLSPVKIKFTGKDEIVLVSEILQDLLQGAEIPMKKNDRYWSELADRVEERMVGSWSKEQLCDKLKRMKTRYLSMAEKFRQAGEQKFRSTVDQELFGMWDQMWGSGESAKINDAGKAKKKRPKVLAVASPVKQLKSSHNMVIAPVEDTKVVAEESEGHEGNEDLSKSDESGGAEESQKDELDVTCMETEVQGDPTRGLEANACNMLSHSVGEARRVFHEEIQTMVVEALKEWQAKVLPTAIKVVASDTRVMNGFEMGGFDGLVAPIRGLEMRDLQLLEGDEALQKQWNELRVKELELYCERLELMQRECKLKQEQLKLQLSKSK